MSTWQNKVEKEFRDISCWVISSKDLSSLSDVLSPTLLLLVVDRTESLESLVCESSSVQKLRTVRTATVCSHHHNIRSKPSPFNLSSSFILTSHQHIRCIANEVSLLSIRFQFLLDDECICPTSVNTASRSTLTHSKTKRTQQSRTKVFNIVVVAPIYFLF